MAAAVVATAITAVGCGDVPKPAPRSPVATVKDERPKPAPSPVVAVKDAMPRRKKAVKPQLPETLRGKGMEADVPVMLFLDETGKAVKVAILKESQYPELNEAVRKAAMEEEFTPAMRDGVPIAFSVSFTYRFRVED
jgi:protein TonB